MKIIKLILGFTFSCIIYAQDISFNIDKTYLNQFGKETDMISFNPLFKLDSNLLIHNKRLSLKIKRLPNSINKSKTAYGFMFFTGLNNSSFDKEITILVEDYMSINPIIHIDRNGNLDFNDDGIPLTLKDKLDLKLINEDINSAFYNYQIAKSQINKKNESRLRNRYASKFPKSVIIPANNWLTNKRLSVRMSKEMINSNLITVFLIDSSVDGLFTFQTEAHGDRILIVEGEFDVNKDLTFLFGQAEPIDHNAVFKLYGKNYYIKSLSKNGDDLTIAETSKDTRVMFKAGQNISSFTINLLDGTSTTIKDLITEKKHLLIDVGGTWCGGCIRQEPTIKNLYKSGEVEVIGVFDHDTPQSVREYVKKHNLKWPVARVDSTFRNMFNINSYPTYILISPKGEIILADMNSEQIVKHLKSIE